MAAATRAGRLDVELVERGLAESRNKAQALVMAGDVLVDGAVAVRSSQVVGPDAEVTLRARPQFVSRGGEKLRHALDVFDIDVNDRVCADFGASTGGFTDCLLQAGATRVYAVDVGYGQLDYRLRQDNRVLVMERTNARYLDSFSEPVSLVVIDVSFISLNLILPVARSVLDEGGECVALVKPQFEAGRNQIGKGGVVKDAAVHEQVLSDVCDYAVSANFQLSGLTASPLKGPAGNVEFLMHLATDSKAPKEPTELLIRSALTETI
ncbi:TlyA family rRNA (cytidine-2'-O)-methyltransferase [soil metagenome]